MAFEARSPADVRNIVLVGPTGAGKTTLVRGLLTATGTSGAVGPQTRVEGPSVALSVTSCRIDGTKINLVDTPGHPDFVGELRAGLRAADAALFVVSATDGVDGATALLWQECASLELPRAVVVTHLDRPGADFEESVAVCQRVFGEGVLAIYLPLHEEAADADRVVGLIGLLSLRLSHYGADGRRLLDADPEHRDLVAGRRAELVELVVQESEDDALLDRYLAGDEPGLELLVPDLDRAVARGSCHPVLPVVAPTGVGTAELLELLVRGFPSPVGRSLPAVSTPEGDPRGPLTCDADGPFVAQVVRTSTDPGGRRTSLVRVFSGTRDQYGAGDLCLVAGLVGVETGGTLSDPVDPLLVEPWVLPEPALAVALRVGVTDDGEQAGDGERLAAALGRLCLEDLTMRVEPDPHAGRPVLRVMGQAHLAQALTRLERSYGVSARAEPLRPWLRETFAGPGSGRGRPAGDPRSAVVCEVRVEPLPTGSGIEFVDALVSNTLPPGHRASIEKAVRSRAEDGLPGGYPLTDVRVTLTDGWTDRAEAVDETIAEAIDEAIDEAVTLALAEAGAAAGMRLLEPVDRVEVVVDDEYLPAVLADLSARRGRITGTEPLGTGSTAVRADVPAASLARYGVELRSVAHGTGAFTRRYVRHEPAPPQRR
jgi:elongation factor G